MTNLNNAISSGMTATFTLTYYTHRVTKYTKRCCCPEEVFLERATYKTQTLSKIPNLSHASPGNRTSQSPLNKRDTFLSVTT
jgi:hypothetical protein